MAANDTKQRIVEAAAAEFSEKGFAGATTRAIAIRAGVNEVTLFRHFGNKQELFAAVFSDVPLTRSIMDKTLSTLREMAPREALYEMAIGQLKSLEQNLPWLRLQMMEPGAATDTLHSSGFRFRSALADYFRLWQERGALRADVNPDLAGEVFAASVLGFVLANRVIFPNSSAASAEAFVRTQVALFLAGMEARA